MASGVTVNGGPSLDRVLLAVGLAAGPVVVGEDPVGDGPAEHPAISTQAEAIHSERLVIPADGRSLPWEILNEPREWVHSPLSEPPAGAEPAATGRWACLRSAHDER